MNGAGEQNEYCLKWIFFVFTLKLIFFMFSEGIRGNHVRFQSIIKTPRDSLGEHLVWAELHISFLITQLENVTSCVLQFSLHPENIDLPIAFFQSSCQFDSQRMESWEGFVASGLIIDGRVNISIWHYDHFFPMSRKPSACSYWSLWVWHPP